MGLGPKRFTMYAGGAGLKPAAGQLAGVFDLNEEVCGGQPEGGASDSDSELDDELESIFLLAGSHGRGAAPMKRGRDAQGALQTMPDEVVLQVLMRVACAATVCRCAQVCRKFKDLVMATGQPLWRRLFFDRWGSADDCRAFEHPLSSHSGSDGSHGWWKEAYRKWFHVDQNWKKGLCSVNSLEGHVGSVCGCVLMGDTLVTVGEDASVKWWDLKARSCNFSLERAHLGPIWSLKFHGNHVVTSSSDSTLKVWHCGKQHADDSDWTHAPMQCQLVLRGHRQGEVWTCDMTCDSIFSGGRDAVAKVWDRETGANYLNLASHTSSVFKILGAVGPAGAHSVLTCGGDGVVFFWDMRTGKPCLTLQGDGQPIFCADVVDDHAVILAGGDSRAARYDLRSGRNVHTFLGHTDSIWDLHCNTLSNRLVTVGTDCSVRVWDNLSGENVSTHRCHLEPVGAVACDASRIVSGDAAGWIFIWDFNNEGATCEYVQLMRHVGPI